MRRRIDLHVDRVEISGQPWSPPTLPSSSAFEKGESGKTAAVCAELSKARATTPSCDPFLGKLA